ALSSLRDLGEQTARRPRGWTLDKRQAAAMNIISGNLDKISRLADVHRHVLSQFYQRGFETSVCGVVDQHRAKTVAILDQPLHDQAALRHEEISRLDEIGFSNMAIVGDARIEQIRQALD